MDGMRTAALALTALCEADRAWMLAQFSRAQQRALRRLLREVRALGLAPDAAALRELTEPAPAAPREDRLRTASAPEVHALLREEPDWLIAALLRAGRFPWRKGLLEVLGAERRRRVETALDAALEIRPQALAAAAAALESRLLPAEVP
jgi:hypothetical protein